MYSPEKERKIEEERNTEEKRNTEAQTTRTHAFDFRELGNKNAPHLHELLLSPTIIAKIARPKADCVLDRLFQSSVLSSQRESSSSFVFPPCRFLGHQLRHYPWPVHLCTSRPAYTPSASCGTLHPLRHLASLCTYPRPLCLPATYRTPLTAHLPASRDPPSTSPPSIPHGVWQETHILKTDNRMLRIQTPNLSDMPADNGSACFASTK